MKLTKEEKNFLISILTNNAEMEEDTRTKEYLLFLANKILLGE